jgi:insertion element IS1 protein InsB
LGRRDNATCQRRLAKTGLEGRPFITGDWEGFHRLIPEDQLFTGKDLIFPIAQDNGNIRHYLARFRRRTKIVSKCPVMADLSFGLHHHPREPKNYPALASVVLSIIH